MALIDTYIQRLREYASQVPDKRTGENIHYSIIDIVLTAFSVFYFQCPSWLNFQRHLVSEEGCSNLNTIFKCKDIPTDNHVRNILDGVDPAVFTPMFDSIFDDFRSSDSFKQYKVLGNHYLIAIDGTEFHNSKNINCKNCYTRYHKKDDNIDFVHIAVGSALCSPNVNEVISFAPVFVKPQECGNGKQDTECKAASRMLPDLNRKTTGLKRILLLDAIYGNSPMIKTIRDNDFNYIITAKEGSQSNVFSFVDGATLDTKEVITNIDGKKYRQVYRFMNDIPLINNKQSIKVNYIELTETEIVSEAQIEKLNKKASIRSKNKTYKDSIKESKFTYITNITPTLLNIVELIKCGRTRWRIENGFNSLKQRGYHFEHNFGHGKETLSSVLATLLILSFLINSVSILNDDLLIKVQEKFNSYHSFAVDMSVLTKYMYFGSINDILLFMHLKLYRKEHDDPA
jgi:hypothetical protein